MIMTPIELSIKRKIESVGIPLKDWNIQINYGIKTGFNDAFIISSEKRNEILSNCATEEERSKTDEIIRPILRGRDIKRYSYDWANLWLIWVPWHFPLHNDTSIQGASDRAEQAFKEQYPALYNHLLTFKKELSARNKAETGIRYEWYALQRWGANYWEDFNRPKILFQEIVQESQFMIDTDGIFFCNDTGRIIVGEGLYHLLGIMNSTLFFYSIKSFYGGGILGDHGIRMKHTFFENFPCIPIQERISLMAEHLSQDPEPRIQKELDDLVFRLYGLTKDEVDYIHTVVNQ